MRVRAARDRDGAHAPRGRRYWGGWGCSVILHWTSYRGATINYMMNRWAPGSSGRPLEGYVRVIRDCWACTGGSARRAIRSLIRP